MVDRLRRCDYPPDPVEPPRVSWDRFDGPIAELPQTRADIVRVFGDPGIGRARPYRQWERRQMVVARDLPTPRGKLYCHRLAEPYLREALRRADIVAPDTIRRIGAFAFRHQRHDKRRPLSLHAWGIALDVNPRDNRARRVTPTLLPWTDAWFELWPAERALPKLFVEAFRSVGWSWGGDWRPFCDPMHFELRCR